MTAEFLEIEPPFLIILLASFTTCVVVLRTLFCFSQNARGAICTRSLTNEFVASLHLIIWTAKRVISLLRKRYDTLRVVMRCFASL